MHALIIVDMQKGVMAGNPPRHQVPTVVARINRLSQASRARGIVIFIQHTDAAEGYAKGTQAWEIVDELERSPADLCVEKCACDSFLETELKSLLDARGVKHLTIAGCATDFCVDTTVRTAAALGYAVTVAGDAHTTRDRPHLDAVTIIKHHNYMWADLLLPRGAKVRVIDTEERLREIAAL